MLCSKCGIDKDINEFAIRKDCSGEPRRKQCKQCIAEAERKRYDPEQKKEYWEKNKEAIRNNNKQRRQQNRERYNEIARLYYVKNKDKINSDPEKRKYIKQWNGDNKERVRELRNARRRRLRLCDVDYKIKENISRQIRKNIHKTSYLSVMKFLGYSIKELKHHLGKQFLPDMTWNNYGSLWDMEHIIPQRLFDFSNKEDIKKCWSLRNLRPLQHKDNLEKNGKLDLNLVEEYGIQDLLPEGAIKC